MRVIKVQAEIMGWVYTTGMVIQDGIRLVRFHTRALLSSFASQNPPPSAGRLSVTCAFVINPRKIEI